MIEKWKEVKLKPGRYSLIEYAFEFIGYHRFMALMLLTALLSEECNLPLSLLVDLSFELFTFSLQNPPTT